jgi:hypothetical protein
MRSPEKIPVKIPMMVIPIWTVERNESGFWDSCNASLALTSPLLACASNLGLRDDTNAISAIEKNPLIKINRKRMNKSLI